MLLLLKYYPGGTLMDVLLTPNKDQQQLPVERRIVLALQVRAGLGCLPGLQDGLALSQCDAGTMHTAHHHVFCC
jgi:hypothetical protein